ncbi:Endo-1,3-1,4-beta-D-glucanase protein [Vigna angularis]|uniref:Endo-1,3-1,4-beta-D-glucanase protein n=1 Tax=Phaseolus angularis TaxID=3914 RepID=A0A8T0JEY1_PHAAN|nr:Endo-1,3-1,4-beta-D-glucanase protein [Vigna angularis]
MVASGCFSNAPVLNASSGVGHVINVGGVNSYVTGSPLAVLAILLVSDVYGFKAPLLRKIADKVADNGYYVLVPDFLHGDPYDPKNVSRPTRGKSSEEAKSIIEALKRKNVSAVGVAGFCWGGVNVPIAILGAEHDSLSPPKLVKEFEEVLKAKPQIDSYVKVFPNVSHGWTLSLRPFMHSGGVVTGKPSAATRG